jgi:hypothetical protein
MSGKVFRAAAARGDRVAKWRLHSKRRSARTCESVTFFLNCPVNGQNKNVAVGETIPGNVSTFYVSIIRHRGVQNIYTTARRGKNGKYKNVPLGETTPRICFILFRKFITGCPKGICK